MSLWAPPRTFTAAFEAARPFLARACARTGADQTPEEILSLCADPKRVDWQLWLWLGRSGVELAGATQLQHPEGEEKRITLVSCAGDGLRHLVQVTRTIEAWALLNGCKLSRIEGRKGWARLLGYDVVGKTPAGAWIMERKL